MFAFKVQAEQRERERGLAGWRREASGSPGARGTGGLEAAGVGTVRLLFVAKLRPDGSGQGCQVCLECVHPKEGPWTCLGLRYGCTRGG